MNSPYPFSQASQFSKKIYQIVLNNIVTHMFDKGDIKGALIYVEKGIDFSLKESNLRHLPDLIFMKFKILYDQRKYNDAKEYYNRTVSLYKIMNKDKQLVELEESAKIDYPEIFLN